MFTLRLLGGLRLENGGADPSGRGTQRLRLAILAVLGLAPSRRLTRDRLLAILWPEASEDEGRRRLSSALYDIRHLLGEQAITSHGDELCLDATSVRVDVEEFLEAVKREAWDEAAALYAGAFLDGVHASGSAEFEDWLEAHRARLHRAHLHVLEQLASRYASAGEWARAAERWEELVELEPLTGRWTLELMRAKAALNDRAGAIRSGAAFEARIAEEFGVAPDPALASFLVELRAAPVPRASAPVPQASALPPRPELSSVEASPIRLAAPTPNRPIRTAVRPAAWLAAGGMTMLAALLLSLRGSPATTDPPAVRIAVFPFTVTGDSGFHFLRDGLIDLLSADLEGVGRFTAVDPHSLLALVRESPASPDHRELARRLGATRFVLGQVYGLRDSVRLQAALHDATTGTLLHEVRAEGPLEAVPSLVDRLTAQLAAAEFGGPGDRLASVAALTSRSIPALREFLAGEAEFRRGRFAEATLALRRAVSLDTSFALAHYRLALAILWGNDPGAETAIHDSLALRHADRLSPRDRALVETYIAWRSGNAAGALTGYRLLVSRYPDDVEAWYQLGETEFHYGPQLGVPIAESRVSFERVSRLDPSHWGARWHLALLDAHEGHPDAFRTRVTELLAVAPNSGSALEIQLVAGFGPEGAHLPKLDQVGELELFGAGWRRAVYLRDLNGAAELFTAMTRSGRSPNAHRLGRTAAGQLALARGRWPEALAEWRRFPSTATFELEVMGVILPGFERPTRDRDEVARRLGNWRRELGPSLEASPGVFAETLRLEALLAASAGDTAQVAVLVRQLETTAWPQDLAPLIRSWAAGVRGYLGYRQGRYEDALADLAAGRQTFWYGQAVTFAAKSRSLERFLEAELLRLLGRPAEALAWYRSFDEHAVHDLIFLVPSLIRSVELNAQLGRSGLAAEQSGRAAELWREADPEYQALLAPQIALSMVPRDGR